MRGVRWDRLYGNNLVPIWPSWTNLAKLVDILLKFAFWKGTFDQLGPSWSITLSHSIPCAPEKHRDTARICIAILLQKMLLSWLEVVSAPPICMTWHLPGALLNFCSQTEFLGAKELRISSATCFRVHMQHCDATHREKQVKLTRINEKTPRGFGGNWGNSCELRGIQWGLLWHAFGVEKLTRLSCLAASSRKNGILKDEFALF